MRKILLLLLVAPTFLLNAQSDDLSQLLNAEIKVIGRAQEDRILLRWAPTTPVAWKKLNGIGYSIERYTISRKGVTLPAPEKVNLAQKLTPLPLESWITLVESNDNAAIAAQAIYGEDFNVEAGSELERIVTESEGLQQRFTFGLFSADQDFEVAKTIALGYEDTTVIEGEKYVYRVAPSIKEPSKAIDYGGVFIGLDDYEPLPVPLDFVGVFTDQNAMLSWNYEILASSYGNYNIERSVDGISFKRLNKRPYSMLKKYKGSKSSGKIFYIDSVQNNRTYYYRVQGISTFGEEGPYSEVVSGMGKEMLKYSAHITTKELINDTTVKLTWEFPEEGEDKIKGFELNRSNTTGETIAIVKKNISPLTRSTTFDKLTASNYFTITAIGLNGNSTTSFPVLVQPVDSIPPAVPTELTGKVDSLGVVTLTWKKNTEEDFLGYRIFKGSKQNEEFSQITASPVKETSYVDTININNLNRKIFYTVASVDLRYNTSKASAILVLEKPDLIPPASPVFKRFKAEQKEISLEWAKSSSKDAIETLLYRKQNEEGSWNLIATLPNIEERFTDKDTEEGNLYSYIVVSRDQSGLESTPSQPVVINLPKQDASGEIKGFYASADRDKRHIALTWRYKGESVAEFQLYKSKKEAKPSLLRVIPADATLIYDNDVTINTQYTYLIRAVYSDGRISEIKQTNVKY